MEVLVIRQKRVSLSAIEVVVPNADDGEEDRKVTLQGGLLEVLVHTMSTLQERFKVVVANIQSDRETNRTPQAVTTTNPVPELEHVGGVDTEGLNGFGIRGESYKVLGDVSLVLGKGQEPGPRGLGIRDSLLGSERFAGDNEQSTFWVADSEGLCEVGSINVGDEVGSEVPFCVGLERFGHHDGTQIGTTNTDVDDGVDGFSGVTFPGATSNRIGELFDVGEHTRNFADAALLDLEIIKVTQGNV